MFIYSYLRGVICEAGHFECLVDKGGRFIFAVEAFWIKMNGGERITQLILGCFTIGFEGIKCGPLPINFILNNNVIDDTAKIQNISDILFELSGLKLLVTLFLPQLSQLVGKMFFLQLILWLSCKQLFLHLLMFVISLQSAEKHLLLKLFHPSFCWLHLRLQQISYLWRKLQPFLIHYFRNLIFWDHHRKCFSWGTIFLLISIVFSTELINVSAILNRFLHS